MQREILKYLLDIKDSIDSIFEYLGENRDFNEYKSNKLLRRGIERELEIIGEATKKISIDFKLKWDTISWKDMAGMRDRLIHNYMGINYSIVWDVIKNKMPELTKQIHEVIENEDSTTGDTAYN